VRLYEELALLCFRRGHFARGHSHLRVAHRLQSGNDRAP
jgi:hypothetical protein